MAEKANSLSHTKWMCKYHIVFTPKYSLRNTNICDTNQCQYNLWDNWLVHKTV